MNTRLKSISFIMVAIASISLCRAQSNAVTNAETPILEVISTPTHNIPAQSKDPISVQKNAGKASNQMPFLDISWVKDLANIVFFAIIATIAIKTYFQAKKTIFTPLKTEVFKMQLKLFEEIISFCKEVKDVSYLQYFELNSIFNANYMRMLIDYTEYYPKIGLKPADDVRDKILSDYPYLQMPKKIPDGWKLMDGHTESDKHTSDKDSKDDWDSYKLSGIAFSKSFAVKTTRLRDFSSSPLIPDSVKDPIDKLVSGLIDELTLMSDILEENVCEFPKRYKKPEEVKSAVSYWLWNVYVDRSKISDKDIDNIQIQIRDYLDTENILNLS